ncbi:hypothetical protein F7Q99_35095 [Streptomyces kaniharaensis]|uniref:Uncharacterized protein n=1 Tax=Streptomyces kaniharaensis TaxID=212423 RepID=A0A6N7L3X0_9ACTN|nr:hypothetical protein [Streptomyces kaniharaensis]MQS17268.1 hypothetical protein [Streptomyces kaniharaensis]
MNGTLSENASGHDSANRLPADAAPGSGVTLETGTLLTRAMLTKEQMSSLLPQLARDELYELGNWLRDAADDRLEQELLQVLRAMCARCPDQAGGTAASVEFVTNANYSDGVYWDEETLWLHGTDGREWQYEAPEQQDDSADALDARFRDLLAAYSRLDRPKHNSNLTVNLSTGTFEVTPP